MPRKKLILVSASFRRLESTESMPAFDRYIGAFFRVIKKCIRRNELRNTDILIISEKHGVIKPDTMIPYDPPEWGHMGIKNVNQMREANLRILSRYLGNEAYSEIFVVAGRQFLELVEGFEEPTNAKVTYAQGRLGPKARELRAWISTGTTMST